MRIGAVVRAPGRANLIGEHTDHTDGLVLPVAIDRGVRLTVAAELAALGRRPVGLAGHLDSDLPQGSGLSSSAALEVVVGTALCAAADLDLPPLELAAACRRAEHRAVGVPSGIMDQAASILGRAGHAVLLDCGTLEHRTVPLPPDHALLLVDSGVRRQLETSGYAHRTRELAAALPALGGRRPADVDVAELPSPARPPRRGAGPAPAPRGHRERTGARHRRRAGGG